MNNKCPFCDEFDHNQFRVNSRIIMDQDDFLLIPTVGCFIDGYCLFLPKDHYSSFADIDFPVHDYLNSRLEEIRRVLAKEFSFHFIIAEHGDRDDKFKRCSCITHAHLHFIPVQNPADTFMMYYNVGGSPIILSKYSDIKQIDGPYMHLSPTPSQHLVWTNIELFGKQFVRRVTSILLGYGEVFDWRIHRFEEKMRNTLIRTNGAFNTGYYHQYVADKI